MKACYAAQRHQMLPEESTAALEAPDYLHTVGLIDASMQKFMFSLPDKLNCNHIGTILESSERVFRRQANVLHARYTLRPALAVYWLIVRQIGFYALKDSSPSPEPHKDLSFAKSRTRMQTHLDNTTLNNCRSTQRELILSLYTTCVVSCVRTACELIEYIQRATTEDATGAWLYSMFCTFS